MNGLLSEGRVSSSMPASLPSMNGWERQVLVTRRENPGTLEQLRANMPGDNRGEAAVPGTNGARTG